MIAVSIRRIKDKNVITLWKGHDLRRSNKSNFNEGPNIPVNIRIRMHDTLFSPSSPTNNNLLLNKNITFSNRKYNLHSVSLKEPQCKT